MSDVGNLSPVAADFVEEEFDAAAETSGQRKRSTSTPEVNSPKIIGKRGWGREQLPPVDESEGKGGGCFPSVSIQQCRKY